MIRTTFIRPIWTCGRYNKEHNVAIYYNLITGMSYYFEDESACVIGKILETKRNCIISLNKISNDLLLEKESIISFFDKLSEIGLIANNDSYNILNDYRRNIRIENIKDSYRLKTTNEKLPFVTSNAEMAYTQKVGGITSVMFELTYNCSEKCIHCYNIGATRNENEISHRDDRKELSLDEYKHVIDELNDQGLFKVCLTGGDPFSKPFVWDIIDYLYQKEIAFDIFTNGQRLLGHEERLANSFPRIVGISLYSGIPEIHDYITRVKGSWDKSMSVIKELSNLAVPMNLKCCVMRPNVKSYYMVADIAKKYGVIPQFEVSLTDSVDGDKCVSKYLRLTPEQLEIVLRDENIPLYVGREAPNYGGQLRQMNQNACGAGEHSLCITPEGNVIPCCAFHTLFGNIKNESINTILLHSKERTYWNKLTLFDYEECGQFDYCAYCNLCPGNNFVEHGTPLKASEVNCSMAKARYELSQKMKQGYDPLEGLSIRNRLELLPEYKPETIKRVVSQNHSDKRLTVGG